MRLLLVDDSMLVRSMIKSLINQWDEFEVVGECSNGKAAVKLASQLEPDLILMDVNMPEMNGIEATEIIMKTTPRPIVVFTSEDVALIGYKCLEAGALEVIPKPDIVKMNDATFSSGMRSMLNHTAKHGFGKLELSQSGRSQLLVKNPAESSSLVHCKIMVIGASTGGPTTVRKLLSSLPGNFPVPILLSQHIEQGFDKGYADWLNDATNLRVHLAGPSQKPQAGEVLVAPATHHLVCHHGEVILDDGPRVDNQKPSIDKMFLSALKAYGDHVTAVLLTGMGRDGAKGCLAIKEKGGYTLVQDEKSSLIFGMPKAAIELGGASSIMSINEMGPAIKRMLRL